MRRSTSRGKDERFFRKTAGFTKAINLGKYTFRGGIRF